MRLPPAAIIPQYYRQYYPQYHPIYLDIARGGIVGRKAGCEGAAFQPRADGNPERLAARNESPARGREPVPGTALQPSESHGVCGPRGGRVAAGRPDSESAMPHSRRLCPCFAGVSRRHAASESCQAVSCLVAAPSRAWMLRDSLEPVTRPGPASQPGRDSDSCPWASAWRDDPLCER